MSNASPKQPDLEAALTDQLRRPVSRPATPVQVEVKQPASKPARNSAVVKQKVELEIHTGDSTSILSCRQPTDLLGQIKIESVRRQMGKFDGPKFISEIVEEALRDWYAKNVAA